MGSDMLQSFEPVLDKPQSRAPPVCCRVLGDEGAQVVTLMSARLLALNGGQVYTPMIQDLTSKLSFFGGDEHRALGLGQHTTYVVERAIRDVACQPVAGGGGDPGAPDLVERVGQQVAQGLALKGLQVHQRI